MHLRSCDAQCSRISDDLMQVAAGILSCHCVLQVAHAYLQAESSHAGKLSDGTTASQVGMHIRTALYTTWWAYQAQNDGCCGGRGMHGLSHCYSYQHSCWEICVACNLMTHPQRVCHCSDVRLLLFASRPNASCISIVHKLYTDKYMHTVCSPTPSEHRVACVSGAHNLHLEPPRGCMPVFACT